MPFVGQIVHHFKVGGDPTKPQPAIVARVLSDTLVNLGFWNTNGVPSECGAARVAFITDTSSPPKGAAYCKPPPS